MGTNKEIAKIGYGVTSCIYLFSALYSFIDSISLNNVYIYLFIFYVAMPTMSFIIGMIFGIKDAFMKWFYPLVFGAFGPLIFCVAARGVGFAMFFLLISFIPSLFGVAIGVLIRYFRA